MPIKGLSEHRRLPRLGKVRLGLMVGEGKGAHPEATSYFVCPLEVQKACGEKPTVLDIVFPTDDVDQCVSIFYRCYSFRGLVCWGDGEIAHRWVDVDKVVNKDTGELPSDKDPKFWPIARGKVTARRYDITCLGDDCEETKLGHCTPKMFLQFLLLKVERIGVWQIDTKSTYSIENILGGLDLIKRLGHGHFAFIPLKLELVPHQVMPDGVKKTNYILQVTAPYSIQELSKYATLPEGRALLPAPDMESPDDPPDVIEGEAKIVPDPEAALFSPQAIEERDRQLLWKDICQLMTDSGQARDTLVSWFKRRHNFIVSLEEVKADTFPRVATLEILTSLRDNLKTYKDQMPKKPKQEKLV